MESRQIRPFSRSYFAPGVTNVWSSPFYVYTSGELFARLVSICLTEPRKARQLAPRATAWLMRELYSHPRIRKVLTEADGWELGTTGAIDDRPKDM
jgi:hypothetical protein